MSLNKYIHPRNKYKTIVNFKKLATENEEFGKYCKMDLSGKIQYDFSNKDAVICLSTLLLKNDFNLYVRIPKDTLTPSIPARLNYILWIEDIFANLNVERKLFGIDIGCGAACIFPLLIARMYEWNMLGTEINDESVVVANENVYKNNLQHLIKISKVPPSCYLVDALENVSYDFCMCNPPFFCSESELHMETKSRSKERKQHSNCQTGLKEEVITPGGEVQFVKNIIADSVSLKDRIRLYTVMLGHKKSVPLILKELKNRDDIQSIGRAQFCQGNTMRWGVAWSFCLPSVYNFLPVDQEKNQKKMIEMNFLSKYDNAEKCFDMIDDHANKLQFERKLIDRDVDTYALTLTAYENTWSNQRRKRREMARMEKGRAASSSKNSTNADNSIVDKIESVVPTSTSIENINSDESLINYNDRSINAGDCNELVNSNNVRNSEEMNDADRKKRPYSETDDDDDDHDDDDSVRKKKFLKTERRNDDCNRKMAKDDPLIRIDLFVIFNIHDKTITLRAKTLYGQKILTGQVLQYFKNNFSADGK